VGRGGGPTAVLQPEEVGVSPAYGVGPDTAAQLLITAGANPERLRTQASFTALCGAAPVPASSGKTNQHRLSRGGDRAANAALYRIALTRMARDQRTRGYVARQTDAGRTKTEIIRLLKRAIAREVFRLLTTPVQVPHVGWRTTLESGTSSSPSAPAGSTFRKAGGTSSARPPSPGSPSQDHPRSSKPPVSQQASSTPEPDPGYGEDPHHQPAYYGADLCTPFG
jgi:hypothetical protein